MEEVEETLRRLEAHKDLMGTIIVNAEGIAIRSTLDKSSTIRYAPLLRQLTLMARSTVRDMDPQNDLTFLRLHTRDLEVMVALENDFLLISFQKMNQ